MPGGASCVKKRRASVAAVGWLSNSLRLTVSVQYGGHTSARVCVPNDDVIIGSWRVGSPYAASPLN